MNVKGGHYKRLLVEQNASSESTCMLNSEFLKGVDRYTLRFEHFLLNQDINLFPDENEILVQIGAYNDPLMQASLMGVRYFQESD